MNCCESASEIPLNTNFINIMKQIRGPNRGAIFKNWANIGVKCTAKNAVLRNKGTPHTASICNLTVVNLYLTCLYSKILNFPR